MKHLLLFTCIIVFFSFSCEDNENDDSDIDIQLFNVRVDLQWGFEDQLVNIKFNDEECFNEYIEPGIPFSGPQASFDIILHKGVNQCEVYCQDMYQMPLPVGLEFSVEIVLSDLAYYFIGFGLNGDSLITTVSEYGIDYVH